MEGKKANTYELRTLYCTAGTACYSFTKPLRACVRLLFSVTCWRIAPCHHYYTPYTMGQCVSLLFATIFEKLFPFSEWRHFLQYVPVFLPLFGLSIPVTIVVLRRAGRHHPLPYFSSLSIIGFFFSHKRKGCFHLLGGRISKLFLLCVLLFCYYA